MAAQEPAPGMSCCLYRSRTRFGYAACSYSLISPCSTFRRRTCTTLRLVTGAGRFLSVGWALLAALTQAMPAVVHQIPAQYGEQVPVGGEAGVLGTGVLPELNRSSQHRL